MQKDLVFSIIIPVHNRAQFLPDLFTSIRQLNERNLEIIFVDNNSTDDSINLLYAFSAQHSSTINVSVHTCSKEGACAARNVGLSKAKGEYVYFFDSDDLLSPHFFTNATALLPADVIICRTRMVWNNGKQKIRDIIYSAHPSRHIISSMLSTQSMIIRKELLINIGKWDESLRRWNDYELGSRLLLAQPTIKWMRDNIYHTIRIHDNSITGNSFTKDVNELLSSLNTVCRNILNAPLDNHNQQKCLTALYCKHLLLKNQLLSEGSDIEAKQVEQAAIKLAIPKWKQRSLNSLAKTWNILHLPGLWRLFNILV